MQLELFDAANLVGEADVLVAKKRYWRARTKVRAAIALLERYAADSNELARAYLDLCFIHFEARVRKENRLRNQLEAVSWYEKAIAVWRRNGNVADLGGNLTNIGALYLRIGDQETALLRAEEGLQVEKQHPTPVDSPAYRERVHSWTHAASHNIRSGQLDRAEAILRDGFDTFGEDTPDGGALWAIRAKLFEKRAAICREVAERLLPPDSCAL